MEKFSLSSDEGYTAEVYKHGCHVTKWCEPDGTVSPMNGFVWSSLNRARIVGRLTTAKGLPVLIFLVHGCRILYFCQKRQFSNHRKRSGGVYLSVSLNSVILDQSQPNTDLLEILVSK